MLIKEKGMWKTRRHACNSIVVKQRHAAADRQTPPDPYSTADVKAQTGLDWIASVSCGLAARGESRSYEGSTQSIRRTTLTRMAMGTRETDQPPLWIATSDLPPRRAIRSTRG